MLHDYRFQGFSKGDKKGVQYPGCMILQAKKR